MCLTCGCNEPNNDHGDKRHITADHLRAAAEAAGVTPKKAAKNLRRTVKAMADPDEPPIVAADA